MSFIELRKGQKHFGRRMTPTETLCWRYSYVELMWGLKLSRNAKMKRETDFGLRKTPSRRTKPFFGRFYRFPAAGNRFSENFSHFPPREGVFRAFFPISRRGKAFFERFDRFPAAGRRFWKSEIGFASHFRVSEIPRSVSRFIKPFLESV